MDNIYTVTGYTDQGLVRQANEDCFGCNTVEELCFAYVCDGMGGVEGGCIASNIAGQVLEKNLSQCYRKNLTEKSIYMVMESAFANANANIYDYAQANPYLHGMGTTTCISVVFQNTCYIGNVGDSRVYLLRDHILQQLTVDHTIVQMMVDAGEITPEQAAIHPERHKITRAVGADTVVKPDFFQVDVLPGDTFLLCSDGFHNMVPEHNIADLVQQVATGESCRILIDSANDAGGEDNITVVVIHISGGN